MRATSCRSSVRAAPSRKLAALNFRRFLTNAPGLKIVAEQPYITPGTVPDAMAKMESLLIANPRKGDIDAVWSLFDMPVIGAAMAVEAAGRAGQIGLYGIDGDPQALDLIKRGVMTATIMQSPDKIGEIAAESAVKLAQGESVPKEIMVDVTLITIDNVDQFIGK